MRWKRREVMLGAIGLAGAALLPGVARARALTAIGGGAFGARWRALIPAGADDARVERDIGRLLRSLDAVMSPFRSDSELARLNAADRPLLLSKPLADVVREGLRIAHLTGGAFDPSIGPTVARFGFGPIRMPLASTGFSTNFRDIEISGRTVAKRHANLTFDPCGIGKGYALDLIGQLFAARGVHSFFAEFGGEVLVRGLHPAGRPWRIGIEEPAPGAIRLRHAVAMNSGALATSGDRINAYVVDGRRYSHIVDPRTAAPLNNGVASVSVMAPSAMTADALATALMVMGSARGMAFADRATVPALFVMRDGNGYRDVATAAFRARILA